MALVAAPSGQLREAGAFFARRVRHTGACESANASWGPRIGIAKIRGAPLFFRPYFAFLTPLVYKFVPGVGVSFGSFCWLCLCAQAGLVDLDGSTIRSERVGGLKELGPDASEQKSGSRASVGLALLKCKALVATLARLVAAILY